MFACQKIGYSVLRHAKSPILLSLQRSVSTVSKGTAFEKEITEILRPLGMNLHSCGGPNDRGIDLQGIWQAGSSKIPVYVQCKNTNHSSTAMIREFNGVLGRIQEEIAKGEQTSSPAPIGIFAMSNTIRNSMLREAAVSSYPLILMSVKKKEIVSLQPNYALLRLHPSIQFMFDINRTNIPAIICEGVYLLGDSGSQPCSE